MLTKKTLLAIDWKKVKGLLPVIIQSNQSGEVLMHGYMNQEALNITIKKKIVTFFSRKKGRLWIKGETSGNFLKVVSIYSDCDNDSLLIMVKPIGNTCHLLNSSCFNLSITNLNFLFHFERLLEHRKKMNPENSYTSYLYCKGIKRIAQKVGEEAIEVALAAVDKNNEELINESTDLLYHWLVLLHSNDLKFNTIVNNLKKRNSIKLLNN